MAEGLRATGAAITSEMVADKIDIGSMADFPSVLNAVAASRSKARRSVYLATLSASTTGGGNGLMVPLDSPAQKLLI